MSLESQAQSLESYCVFVKKSNYYTEAKSAKKLIILWLPEINDFM